MNIKSRSLLILPAAVMLGLVIAAAGVFPWTILAQLNARLWPLVPWCLPAGLVWLGLFWLYLDGKGWPRSTSEKRHQLLRARRLQGLAARWSLIAGALGLVTLVTMYLVVIQFVDLPPDAFRPRRVGTLSLGLVVPLLVMNVIVAGVAEEAAYRGYMQGMLERHFNAVLAIAIVTVVFTALHLLGGVKTLPLAIPVAATSVLFGVLTTISRSILPAVVVHTLVDLATLPLEWGLVGHLPVGRFYTSGMDASFIAGTAVAIVGSVATMAALLKLRRVVNLSAVTSPA